MNMVIELDSFEEQPKRMHLSKTSPGCVLSDTVCGLDLTGKVALPDFDTKRSFAANSNDPRWCPDCR